MQVTYLNGNFLVTFLLQIMNWTVISEYLNISIAIFEMTNIYYFESHHKYNVKTPQSIHP